jgi:hypothetical protein
LVAGTGAAAGSAKQRALASPIYSGSFLNATANPIVRQCGGYTVTSSRLEGPSTSPYPRLQGRVTLTARFAITGASRTGFANGQLRIRDRRGRLKARAKFEAVIYRGLTVNGIVTGRLMRPSARLIANVSLFFSSVAYTGGIFNLGLNQAQNSAVAYSPLPKCSRRVGARP